MRGIKKALSVFLSLSILISTFSFMDVTAFADEGFTVSGKVVIATDIDGDTNGNVGIGGIDIYTDSSDLPLGTSQADGTFTVTVPSGTESLTFSNFTFENGAKKSGTGCTIDRTVTVIGSTDVYNAVVPVIVCDYNGDSSITSADYMTFAQLLGSGVDNPNYNVYCNLNGDNAISSADYLTFAKFIGKIKSSYEYSELELYGHEHSYIADITAPNCTEQGYTTYTCEICGDSYIGDYTSALGHTAGEAVRENETGASCTQAGSYDSIIYCTVCGAELSRNTVTVDALGHSWGEWTVTTAATYTSTGTKTRICSRCNETETETIPVIEHIDNIDVKLENTDVYLYRAGNANSIPMANLFKAANESKAIDASGVNVTVTNIAGTAAGTFTKNSTDWSASTLKFTGLGAVKLTVTQYNAQAGENETAAELMLEIVNGTNITGTTLGNVTSNNAVLLNDVSTASTTISNKYTLYGNGFSVTDSRTNFAKAANAYIKMFGGGSIDNAVMLGAVYPTAVTSGEDNQYYAPGIWITGDANIYNSYVSETKNAVQIDGGEVNLVNSTFDGGAISNIQIGGGNVTIKDCTTTTSTRGGLTGLGIRGTSASCKINIEGTFKQYNWVKSSDLPSTYSSVLSSVFNDSNYAYTYNSTKYINLGIFFITDASSITEDLARSAISDSTSNTYGFIEKSAYTLTGTLYTAKASMGSASMMTAPAYSPRTNGQYYTLPAYTFNYTKNDFTTDDKTYCTYNGTTGVTQISFEEDSSMNWDSSILTVTKLGNALPVTVTMNGTDYTGQSIPFTAAGNYTVNYSYTDPYNYDKDGNAYSITYNKTVDISVTVVEKGVQVYHPDFTYADIGGTTASKTVEATVSGAKRIYVMPDVSATSSTIESKTVGGQTVYYPVVTVPASNSSGGTFSSGKLYYFAPAFKYINITDYDQSNQTTKTAQYTYNSSTQKWPHNVTATSQPDTSIYYYTATNTSSNTNRPYGRSMNEQYYGYKYVSSRGGLCFSSNEIEKQNDANSQLVEFYYKGTDDVTYYYYIKYSFEAATGSSGGCVAEGTQVTMGDGSTKAIEDIKVGDEVMSRNMVTGEYEAQSVAIHCYHGTKDWEVLTLKFSDGTEVRSIYDHGYFDKTLNKFVYIRTDNVSEYVGDTFIKQDENGSSIGVTLDGYEITTENVGSYTLVSAYNYNFIVEGMLSITSEDGHDGMFSFFDMGENMTYDAEAMQRDIETYGLYTYEDFSEYLTREQFEALNFKYYKPNVEKGIITFDEIILMIQQYM